MPFRHRVAMHPPGPNSCVSLIGTSVLHAANEGWSYCNAANKDSRDCLAADTVLKTQDFPANRGGGCKHTVRHMCRASWGRACTSRFWPKPPCGSLSKAPASSLDKGSFEFPGAPDRLLSSWGHLQMAKMLDLLNIIVSSA